MEAGARVCYSCRTDPCRCDVKDEPARHRPSPLHVEVTTATVVVHLHLGTQTAHGLYHELYRLQRACGFPERAWRDEYPHLFDVYDALAEVGIDGTQ